MRDQDRGRIASELEPALFGNFVAEGLDSQDAGRGVEAGIEEPRLLERDQVPVEELRADRDLPDLRAIRLADASLFQDFWLTTPLRVKDLLQDDGLDAAHGCLRGYGRAVVPRSGRHHAVIAQVGGVSDRQRGAARLEAAGGVAGLILYKDASAPAAGGRLPHQLAQPGQFP